MSVFKEKLWPTIALICLFILGGVLVVFSSQVAILTDRVENFERTVANVSSPISSDLTDDKTLREGRATKVIVQQHADQISEIASKVGDITAKMDQIELSIKEMSGARPDASEFSATPETPPNSKKNKTELAIQLKQQVAESRERTLDQFYSEPIDDIWSQETQVKLEQSFASSLQSSAELTYIDCRSDSCEARWRINSGLSDLERFQADNEVLIEASKSGLGRIVFLDSLDPGEYRAILKKSENK